MIIDVSRVHQGETFYIIFRVGQEGYETIDEVALMQILPSGWEIENLRLSGGELPEWADLLNLGFEDYVDIRDDRIMWFFTKETVLHARLCCEGQRGDGGSVLPATHSVRGHVQQRLQGHHR